ncbi:MAG: alpha-ketoglutarate-dependent dioxygenase AlkB [Myxococcales bacterium]|nr:alpha-ketoglutarate-dependent dioxygenase AlkB [Myxococcales bacterium]
MLATLVFVAPRTDALGLTAPHGSGARDPRVATLARLADLARQQARAILCLGAPAWAASLGLDPGLSVAPTAPETLAGRLESRAVYLAGGTTQVEILQLAQALCEDRREVVVLDDACFDARPNVHLRALSTLRAMGCAVAPWSRLLADPGRVTLGGYASGDAALYTGRLAPHPAGSHFAAVDAEVAWQTALHRGGVVPRQMALQGEVRDGVVPLYRHPLDFNPEMVPFTPAVEALRRAAEGLVGHPLNHALVQRYRDGRDWIGEHSDKTLDLVAHSKIVNVSLGRTRTMTLRPKRVGAAPAETERVPMVDGSLFVLGPASNAAWLHAITQARALEDDGPRISITLRHIGTFHDPRTGAVWGVGAPWARRADALAALDARPAPDREARRREAERMLACFRDENASEVYDPERYAPGFEVLDLSALNVAV